MAIEETDKAVPDSNQDAEKPPAKPAEKPASAQAGSQCPLLLKIIYGACLAACDGYINANTKMRFGTYGGMMTGNTVSLGRSFAEEEWEDVALFASIVVLFFAGAYVGWYVGRFKKQGSFRYLAPVIGLGFLALEITVHAIKDEKDKDNDKKQKWVSVISPFLMGMVDLIGFKGSLGQHITFMTGNLQKLAGQTLDVISLTKSISDDPSKPNTTKGHMKKLTKVRRDLCLIGALWTCYVLGAIAGACMTKAGDDGSWTLCLPAGIITLLIFINEGPDRSPPAPKKDPPLFRLFNVEGQAGITIADLRTLYDKLGLTLTAEEESRFIAADSNDDGILDRDEFRAWLAA